MNVDIIFYNRDYTLQTRVKLNNNGKYSVTLEDKECNQILPTIIIFDKKDLAIDYAKKCVNYTD